MAAIKAEAITTRLRELLNDGAGVARVIPSSRFGAGIFDGLGDDEVKRLGVLDTKPAEPRIVEVKPHPQRLTIVGSVQLHEITVEVRVVRTLSVDSQVDEDIRDAAQALAAADADVIAQAFEWPPNLTATEAATTTDLRALRHTGSRGRIRGTAGSALALETLHVFSGTAVSRPAST